MLGPVVNTLAIVVCSLLGAFVVRGIGARFEETIKKAIGLAVVFVGMRGAFENERPLLLIMSLVIGAIAGEAVNIDRLMNRAGAWAERKLAGAGGADGRNNFSKAFVQASVLFCSGSMAIVGSMQSGLSGNHGTLFAKSVLDGAISLVFAASMGLGTAFSAIPVLLYQGGITLAAMFARDYLSAEMIREMSAAGSLVVAAIGFNFLTEKEIKIANLIPATFVPLLYLSAERLFQ
ncbi:MAG: DUF554 domain-containing protein [Spirochaetaceae bacterium]|jgi:uncharacterized membrane protein YqgA involved in biofilm formation|nr:DUF554 domain-containing protein [Spirochaetaceae bacterium]